MNIWTYDTIEGWSPSNPPAGLAMLRHNTAPQKHFLVIRKEADGLCMLRMQLPGNPEKGIALLDLTEQQARNLAIAYLEQKAIEPADIEKLADAAELDSARAMFPEWYRENFSTKPESMSNAAECLRTRRFSAGPGIKLIIADDADFHDESQADIILSGTAEVEQAPDMNAELRKALFIRAGVALASALATCLVINCLRKKTRIHD